MTRKTFDDAVLGLQVALLAILAVLSLSWLAENRAARDAGQRIECECVEVDR